MNREDIVRKVTSRKFVLAVAAFLGSLGAGLAGIADPTACAVCCVVSVSIYAACEAYVDGQAAGASQTISTTSVSASATSQKVVEAAFSPDPREGE